MASATEKKPQKTAAPAKKTTAGKSAATKKPAVKKAASKKASAAKKTSATQKPASKSPAPQPAAEKPMGFQRKTIAQRTVDWKTGKTAHLLRWLAMIPLAALAVFFHFFMLGYSFTVLVCCCLIGVLLFYNLADLLRPKYPRQTKVVRRIFTFLLCSGLLVVGITECLIVYASFGNPEESCQYIVVLGAKVRPEGPSASLMDRIYAARDYLNAHPDAVAVVSGGQGGDEPMTEALCMYQQLVALGIDESRIWMEDQATSTWENMQFTLNLIEEKTGTRPEKLGVLSSEYHLFRAGLFARACGIDSVGIPAATSRFSQKINHFMREVAGVWHYILLGSRYRSL